MKRFILIITLFIYSITIEAQERGVKSIYLQIENENIQLYKESHALLIGISDYNNDWPDLPGVKEDIDTIRKVLEYHDFNVVVIENPTKFQIDDAFSNFIAKYGQAEDNRLLFYFAGHGHTITSFGEKFGYIVPIDAPNPSEDQALFQSKAIEMAQIEIFAKRIQSKHAIFLFDACFSGSLFAFTRSIPQDISYKTTRPIRQFITSGEENEQVPDKSIFCQQFITALVTDESDWNHDGYLTGSELGEFLQTTVIRYSYNYQHPQYGKIRNPALDKGDFVFILPNEQDTVIEDIKIEKPILGKAVEVQIYGSIELTTEIGGQLILDGIKLGDINANSKVPIDKVTTGEHKIEIVGNEYWSEIITIYPNQVTIITIDRALSENNANLESSGVFTDSRDGVQYKWVRIGYKVWMTENLNYHTSLGSWCYDNNESYCSTFGKLYDWETAKKICPTGWHLPSDIEWTELIDFLGGENIAGGKMKETDTIYWISPNIGTTNESGFTALPGGTRLVNRNFDDIGNSGFWWSSSSKDDTNYAYYRFLQSSHSRVPGNYICDKKKGLSVRCVRD
jgi:uncharacterized protein (TIGR02145 family)